MPERTYPFKNLVFHGGGTRTLAYHGALPVLEEYGILPKIERVAGTSAGAMTAALVSFRLNARDTIDLYRTLDYTKIPSAKPTIGPRLGITPPPPIERGLGRIAVRLRALNRVVRKYGMHPNRYPTEWMTDAIASQCDGDGRATFADFRRRGFRDLYVVTTNVSTHKVATFSADTTPNAAVVDALVLSQSIPLFFEAPQFDGTALGRGDYYGDGGMLNSYPIHLFDESHWAADNPWFIGGINWETLGCHLHTPEDAPPPSHRRPIASVASYITNLIEILIEAGTAAYECDPTARQRTIDISNCGVSITEFSISPTLDDETYLRLVAEGEHGARRYLEAYRPPTPSTSADDSKRGPRTGPWWRPRRPW